MATAQYRDRRIAAAERKLDKASSRISKAEAAVEGFRAALQEAEAELEAAHSAGQHEVEHLQQHIEWLKSMPVDQTPDGDTTEQ